MIKTERKAYKVHISQLEMMHTSEREKERKKVFGYC